MSKITFIPKIHYYPITIPEFADLLRLGIETIAQKVQMYLPSQNPTCYEYNIRTSKVCRFDFL